jgi:serine/threonine protein kinase
LIIFIVKIKKKVGTGGQGTVFAVENPDTGEDYAIKRISEKDAGDGLTNEIKVLLNKNLHHINLVRYFTFFKEGEYINIVMELCEEGNLENYISKFKDNNIPEEVFLFNIYHVNI